MAAKKKVDECADVGEFMGDTVKVRATNRLASVRRDYCVRGRRFLDIRLHGTKRILKRYRPLELWFY